MNCRASFLFAAVTVIVVAFVANLGAHTGKRERKLLETQLVHVPGQTLTAEVVEFPPGYKSDVHHHAGSVFAYILSGSIRSQNSATGPARIYKAGETFFEPAGSDHLITENPSSTEAASVLAIHIAKSGAVVTRPGRAR